MVKLVDLKGNVYGEYESVAEAEIGLQQLGEAEDDDVVSTFVGFAPSYRIVDAAAEWTFNTTSNRYEWTTRPSDT